MSKAKAKTYKSEAMAAVHEIMEGLHDAGSIDKRTMREFDEACPDFRRRLPEGHLRCRRSASSGFEPRA